VAIVIGASIAAVGGAMMAVTPAYAQEPLPLIGVEVDLGAYGIGGPEDVRRGRVSIVYDPDGVRLEMYYLRDTPTAPRVTYPDPPPTPEPSASPRLETRQTALWVWNTGDLIGDLAERDVFLDFVEAQSITRVFLYLASPEGARPSAGYVPFSSEEIGPLVADLRARGALAYALDGDPDYVLEENHEGVYRTVRRLVDHNRTVPPEQRFYGVRYDIEPYLTRGFQGPDRSKLLDGYVELIAGVSRIAKEGGLAVAVDIPFWFDAPDEETGAYLEAELDGRRRRILEQIMSVVDDIAIMDYRTRAEGPDGALAHAYHELEMGAAMGVDVFVGVETTRLADEDLHTFYGPGTEGLPTRGDARWLVLEAGADRRTRIWLADSEEALAELAVRTAGAALLRHWPAGRPTRVPADKQSFHNLGRDRMAEVTREVVRHLIDQPAFVGLAFHDYVGLSELLSRD
jgi:hypothetical protein